MSRFGDGLAIGPDLVAAAEEATAAALLPLAGRAPDLVCVFVSGTDPAQVASAGERVSALSGAGSLLGCSAGGVLAGGRGVEGRSAVSVFAAVLPGARLRAFHLEVMRAEAGMAVVGLPEVDEQALDGDELAVLLVDPHTFPAAGFLHQSNLALPGLAVVGGLAAGPQGLGSARLFLDGRTVDRGAVGVLLRGTGATTMVSQGCRPIGPPMTVTAATGNVVHQLAGEPALQRIERILGDLLPSDQALASSGLQLGVAMDEYAEDHDFLVRALLGANRETGALVVGDVIEVGRTVRLEVRDADTADASLRELLAGHRRKVMDAPSGGALLFSCNGRGAHLFGASYGGADHDPALVRRELGATAVAGFFADGELGPVAGRNHLHGFTASFLAFPDDRLMPVLALDIGGTKLAAALVGDDGRVRREARAPTPPDPWPVCADLLEKVRAGVRVDGVGVGCGGPMRWPSGAVTPLNILGWQEFPLRDELKKSYPGVPVRVHNDAVCMTIGEQWRGAARGLDDVLGLVVSTGVGGGLVLGGKVVDGASGNAGHLGHVVVEPDGPQCVCGGWGCLEAVARGPAVVAWARERGSPATDGSALAGLAQSGDPVAVAALARAGSAVGLGIASAAALLDVRRAVVGGGLAQSGAPFWEPLQTAFARQARLGFLAGVRVVPAGLGGQAGLVGAAALVLAGDRYWSPTEQ